MRQAIDGPLFIGIDTHALPVPAFQSALEVFAANGIFAASGWFAPRRGDDHLRGILSAAKVIVDAALATA